jgi:mRNA interferase MazF
MFKQGQIWLVNFDPSIGHEYQKIRPALIIESDSYLPLGSLITVIPISSQITKNNLLDVLIPRDTMNRLMSDSLIKTRQISSFDQRRFIKLIGSCNAAVLQSVLTNISLFLDIPVV